MKKISSDLINEIFLILKGKGKTLFLFDENGNRIYNPAQATRIFVEPDKMLVNLIENGADSAVRLYLSDVIKIADVQKLINTLREVATRYNFLFHVRRYNKGLNPKDFSHQLVKETATTEEFLSNKAGENMKNQNQDAKCLDVGVDDLEPAKQILSDELGLEENVDYTQQNNLFFINESNYVSVAKCWDAAGLVFELAEKLQPKNQKILPEIAKITEWVEKFTALTEANNPDDNSNEQIDQLEDVVLKEFDPDEFINKQFKQDMFHGVDFDKLIPEEKQLHESEVIASIEHRLRELAVQFDADYDFVADDLNYETMSKEVLKSDVKPLLISMGFSFVQNEDVEISKATSGDTGDDIINDVSVGHKNVNTNNSDAAETGNVSPIGSKPGNEIDRLKKLAGM